MIYMILYRIILQARIQDFLKAGGGGGGRPGGTAKGVGGW